MEQKFYICEHCGNIIAKVKDAGVPVMCCGQPMKEIVPSFGRKTYPSIYSRRKYRKGDSWLC